MSDERTTLTEAAKEWPLVTIGIPTFNGGDRLRRGLESILAQSYPNLEILISNNASTDETTCICLDLLKKYRQVKYYHHVTNIGMLANFEFLLRHAKGKYFMWLADDDTLVECVLKKYVHYLETNPDYSLVSGKIEYALNGKVTVIEEGFTFDQKSPMARVISFYSKVVYGGMFHGLMHRQLARRVPVRRVIGSDWHFVAGLAFSGKIKHLDFTGYRKHFGGSSRNFKQYASLIGESTFAGKYPYLKISIDAFKGILTAQSIYSSLAFPKRSFLALGSFIATWLGYYAGIYPFVVGGKIKRAFRSFFFIKKPMVNNGSLLSKRLQQ